MKIKIYDFNFSKSKFYIKQTRFLRIQQDIIKEGEIYSTIRDSTVVSIPACRVGDPGSIPGLGVFLLFGWNFPNQGYHKIGSWEFSILEF